MPKSLKYQSKLKFVVSPQPQSLAKALPEVLAPNTWLRLTEIKLPLVNEHDPTLAELRFVACERLGIDDAALHNVSVFKRGYDARKRSAIVLIFTLLVQVKDPLAVLKKRLAHVDVAPDTRYHMPPAPKSCAHRPVIIGFGPCGLFAALILAQMGLKPIVLERGKAVRERTKDTFGLWRKQALNPESNVQFGEGGAGTFSDGKLWSQVSDPQFLGRKVLEEFVKAGAPEEILYVSKPHIGTFRLVSMIEKMRADIEALGGEIRFEAKVADVLIEDGAIRGLTLADGSTLAADRVVLAIGHSARDTFQMLFERGVYVEPKAFSVGFRIEHPQHLIDESRFGGYSGRSRLQAGTPRQQRAFGVQLLHVPGRHRGSGD